MLKETMENATKFMLVAVSDFNPGYALPYSNILCIPQLKYIEIMLCYKKMSL